MMTRMTCGKLHATDYSNVCVTGLFDPYAFQWVEWMADMLSIPKSLFPEIKDSVGDWGCIDPDIFGAEIPIRCIVMNKHFFISPQFCLVSSIYHFNIADALLLVLVIVVVHVSNSMYLAPKLVSLITDIMSCNFKIDGCALSRS